MKTLLLYATYSSGTQQAAQTVAELLGSKGFAVESKEVKTATPEDLQNYDLVVLGSPSWDIGGEGGQPHEHFSEFMGKVTTPVPGKKFAVFGLGDTAYPIFCGAVDHLEAFVKKIQGNLIVPSLKIDGYFFNTDEANQNLEGWVNSVVSAADHP